MDEQISQGTDKSALTWRTRVLELIENRQTQTILTVLLILDVLIVIAGVALDGEYPSCSAALRVCGLKPDHGCSDIPEEMASLGLFLTWISNTILSIFMVEIFLTMYGVGFWKYVCTPSYLFDSAVVFASLAVELAEGTRHHDTGLLVLARAWRFVTLLHGVNHLHHESSRRVSELAVEPEVQYNPLLS